MRAAGTTLAALVVPATAVSGTPAQLAVQNAGPVTGVAGAQTTVVVAATDRFGNPVAGVSVAWQPLSGGGTVSPTTSTTDALGQARATWTMGSAAGAQTLEVRAVGTAVSPYVIQATALAGPAAQIFAVGARAFALPVGSQVPVVVSVTDRFGNPVAGASVSWQPEAGKGTASPLVALTDVEGQARTTWTVTAAGSSH